MQAKSSQFFTSLRHLLSKDLRQYVYVSLTHLYIIVGKISFFHIFRAPLLMDTRFSESRQMPPSSTSGGRSKRTLILW